MIRLFDFIFSIIGLVLTIPIFILIYVVLLVVSRKPLFFQKRVGINKKSFIIVKFRTMSEETTSMATHLVSKSALFPFGSFLRKTKLDELPQLWNVLIGDMSLVGPRPNLFNQEELILARDSLNVYSVKPGITGLSQINGIDMSAPELLAKTDAKMISNMSLRVYFKYIFLTVFGKGKGDNVRP